jgi:predicted MFS family arabinose efflux permease
MVTTGVPGAIVALALFCGVTTGIFKIVSTAVVPMLVDDDELDAANGSILKVQTLTNIAGVAVGGAGLTCGSGVPRRPANCSDGV